MFKIETRKSAVGMKFTIEYPSAIWMQTTVSVGYKFTWSSKPIAYVVSTIHGQLNTYQLYTHITVQTSLRLLA